MPPGMTRWVDDEALMDTVTGISGSAPAYFFAMVEALEEAAVAQGLPRETARALAAQTCLGAGRMMVESGEDPGELRQPRHLAQRHHPGRTGQLLRRRPGRVSWPAPSPPPPAAAANWPPNWTRPRELPAERVSVPDRAGLRRLVVTLLRAARAGRGRARADFNNPLSQFLYRATNPVLAPLRR